MLQVLYPPGKVSENKLLIPDFEWFFSVVRSENIVSIDAGI